MPSVVLTDPWVIYFRFLYCICEIDYTNVAWQPVTKKVKVLQITTEQLKAKKTRVENGGTQNVASDLPLNNECTDG